jgi:hypothetical protein
MLDKRFQKKIFRNGIRRGCCDAKQHHSTLQMVSKCLNMSVKRPFMMLHGAEAQIMKNLKGFRYDKGT